MQSLPTAIRRNIIAPFLRLIQKLTAKFTKKHEGFFFSVLLSVPSVTSVVKPSIKLPVIPANAGIQTIQMTIQTATFWIATSLSLLAMTTGTAFAAINIPFTINLSETVAVTGTPRIAVDVGGNTRYATYTSGTGTNALTFTLSPNIGDVDLDGVTLSSPIDLNGGTIKDTSGNDATLTFTPPNTSGIKINYPSLGMDFTNGTSGRYTLNGTAYNNLSSFLTASGGTFSRNSIATYFDSTGTLQTAPANTPRFDYDPVTHIAKGILIEESRRNYTIYSNRVSTSTSTGYFYSGDAMERFAQNAGMAPDGGNTASFSALNSRFFFESSAAGNATYSMSVWLKMASGTGTAILTVKNRFTDDIKSSSSFTVTTNWQRFSLSGITDGSNPGFRAEVSYPAGMYAWGMQVEQGAFPTSYIPTTGLPATRDAENFYIPAGSWTGSSQGTIASTFDHFGTNTVDGIFALNDGTGNNRADCRAGQQYCFFSASGVDTPLSPLVSPRNTINKAALIYSSTLSAATANGSAALTGAGRVPASMTRLWIGNIDNGIYWLNGHVSTLKYFPLATTTTQLQLLTQ